MKGHDSDLCCTHCEWCHEIEYQTLFPLLLYTLIPQQKKTIQLWHECSVLYRIMRAGEENIASEQ